MNATTRDTIDTLTAGLFRLTVDVKNPKPDRRVVRDWRKKLVIPAGTFFVVRRYDRDIAARPWLEKAGSRNGVYLDEGDPLSAALVPHLKAAEPEKVHHVLALQDIGQNLLLGALLARNAITLAQCLSAAEWLNQDATDQEVDDVYQRL